MPVAGRVVGDLVLVDERDRVADLGVDRLGREGRVGHVDDLLRRLGALGGRGLARRMLAVAAPATSGDERGDRENGDHEGGPGHAVEDASEPHVFPAASWRGGRRIQRHKVTDILVGEQLRTRSPPTARPTGCGSTPRRCSSTSRLAGRQRRHHRALAVAPGHRSREPGRRAGAEPAQRPQPQLLLRQVRLPRRDPDRPPRPARRHAVRPASWSARCTRSPARRPARRRARRSLGGSPYERKLDLEWAARL